MVYSFLLDDGLDHARTAYQAAAAAGADLGKMGPPVSRDQIMERIDEALARPFDPEEAREYDTGLWAKRSVEAMSALVGPQVEDDNPTEPVLYGARPTG